MLSILPALVLTAATVVPVAEFRSIELSDGGHVVVRHGAVQRVSVVQGDLRYTRVQVEGTQLVIEDLPNKAPRDYELEIEIVTPRIASVAVSNGGSIRTEGSFPDQASIDVAVEQGGAIDIRAISADTVNASVYQGGMIFTTVEKTLTASVEHGGAIRYWGDVENVRRSVRHGGVVTRGTARDAKRPLSELGPQPIAPIAPIAPVPPTPPTPPR